jgi:hypothetical protein
VLLQLLLVSQLTLVNEMLCGKKYLPQMKANGRNCFIR